MWIAWHMMEPNNRTNDGTNLGKGLPLGEYRFRMLVDAIRDYAIFMLNTEGFILTWNAGAERIKGYVAEEVIGKHFSILYPQEAARSGKPEMELEIARREGRCEDEGWRVRKDGSQFWANVVITALRDDEGRLYGFGKVTRDLTERKRIEDALVRSAKQLEEENKYRIEAERAAREAEASVRDLSERLQRLQDEERRRLGRELHDSVGQLLIAAKMSLSLAGEADGRNWQTRVGECELILEQAIREVRTVSYLFHPPMLEELGLTAVVESYVQGFQERSGIQIDLQTAEDFGRLSGDVELVLFRVLQESLTNVHRHAGSARAQVRLSLENQTVILEVRDWGKGAPAEALQLSGSGAHGVGLRGMNERVRHLGGNLEVLSSERGTTVRATVPPLPTSAGEELNSSAAVSGG